MFSVGNKVIMSKYGDWNSKSRMDRYLVVWLRVFIVLFPIFLRVPPYQAPSLALHQRALSLCSEQFS